MRHGKKTVKLGRTVSHRDATLSNLATSLFLHEKITTTTTKAKALRPYVDRLISTAKKGVLPSQRQVARSIRNKEVLKKLFQEIVPKLDERDSGFTRILRAGYRKGDGAELAVIELLIERPAEAPHRSTQKKEGRLKKLAGRFRKGSKAAAAESTEEPVAEEFPEEEGAEAEPAPDESDEKPAAGEKIDDDDEKKEEKS